MMPDYFLMYTKMAQATEKAIEILMEAHRECEAMYAADPPDPKNLYLIPRKKDPED